MPALPFAAIAARVQDRVGALYLGADENPQTPYARVDAKALGAVARVLHDDADLDFDFMIYMTAVDYPAEDKITLVYHFWSYQHRHAFMVKADVAREAGRAATVAGVYVGADWYEREVYDLFGVAFDGHPDLRRIMLPDDFVGHPLLKDFKNDDYVPFPEPNVTG
jgi:NADH-quinone oxidoreductase subunit C